MARWKSTQTEHNYEAMMMYNKIAKAYNVLFGTTFKCKRIWEGFKKDELDEMSIELLNKIANDSTD